MKRFLLSEHPRGIACGGLRSAEDEKARGFLAVSGINDRAVRRCYLNVQTVGIRIFYSLAGEAGAVINDEEHRQSCQQRRKHNAGQNPNCSFRSHLFHRHV